jgi:cation transport regulator ChaC
VESVPWIFGYGSLMWRADFSWVTRRPAFIRGFSRRFWQGSIDHRGVPEQPGRVVTLVPDPGARCWGIAYQVEARGLERVLEALDHRERGGYARLELPLHFGSETADARALVYVAMPDNPNFLGPAPLAEIARQVLGASGPSGPNPEYVLLLARALAELAARDDHVFALAELVRADSG